MVVTLLTIDDLSYVYFIFKMIMMRFGNTLSSIVRLAMPLHQFMVGGRELARETNGIFLKVMKKVRAVQSLVSSN